MTHPPDSTELDSEDAACLGMRRPDDFWNSFADLNRRETVKPRSSRKPSLASVAKDARKAGIAVARYEFNADGSVKSIITGQAGSDEASDLDQWIAKTATKDAR